MRVLQVAANAVANEFLDPKIVFFSDEAWFTINENGNGQNNKY
jgi:hypothetical protein